MREWLKDIRNEKGLTQLDVASMSGNDVSMDNKILNHYIFSGPYPEQFLRLHQIVMLAVSQKPLKSTV